MAPDVETVQAPSGMNLKLVQGALRVLGPALGLKPAEMDFFWKMAADRLYDVQALVNGGKLTDGRAVDGLVAMQEAIKRIEQKLEVVTIEPQ